MRRSIVQEAIGENPIITWSDYRILNGEKNGGG